MLIEIITLFGNLCLFSKPGFPSLFCQSIFAVQNSGLDKTTL
jgi:hypothetical protein